MRWGCWSPGWDCTILPRTLDFIDDSCRQHAMGEVRERLPTCVSARWLALRWHVEELLAPVAVLNVPAGHSAERILSPYTILTSVSNSSAKRRFWRLCGVLVLVQLAALAELHVPAGHSELLEQNQTTCGVSAFNLTTACSVRVTPVHDDALVPEYVPAGQSVVAVFLEPKQQRR